MEDKKFAFQDLAMGFKEGIYEEISKEDAFGMQQYGKMISSDFVIWQGDEADRKPRFINNDQLSPAKQALATRDREDGNCRFLRNGA